MKAPSVMRTYFTEWLKRRGAYAGWSELIASCQSWDAGDYERFVSIKIDEVGRLAENTKFYSGRKDRSYLKELEVGSLGNVIPISKTDVMKNGADMRAPRFKGLYRRAYTSGTSGQPSLLYQSLSGLQAEQAFFDALWSRVGFKRNSRLLVLRGGVAEVEPLIAGHLMIAPASFIGGANIESILKKISEFNPEYLHCYASTAVKFANIIKSTPFRMHLGIRGVFCGSEVIYDHQTELIRDAFGCDVLAWYGHSEQGALAIRNSDGSYTFHPLYGYVELLEKADGLFEIVTTGWLNKAMPLIRYRTGDFVRNWEWDRAHAVPVLRVDRILGRDQEMFVGSNGELVPFNHFVFGLHGDAWSGVEDFLFVQKKAGELELRVKIEAGRNATAGVQKLEAEFRNRFGDLAVIKITPADEIRVEGKKKSYFRRELQPGAIR